MTMTLKTSATITPLVDLFRQGHYAEAVDGARQLTESDPANGMAWKILGSALKQLGRGEKALDALRHAAQCAPNDAEIPYNLALIHKELGQLEAAQAACREGLRLQPNFVEAWNNLGNIQRALGQYNAAVESLTKAVELQPNFLLARNNLGGALRNAGRLEDAAACYRQLLKLKPDYAEAHHNLGIVLRDLQHFDEAVRCFRRALKLNPAYAEAENNLGISMEEDFSLSAQAVTHYRKALDLKPQFPDALNNLGVSLQSLGHRQEAIDCFHRALQIRPFYPEASRNLSMLHTFTTDDPLLANLEEQLASCPVNSDDRIQLDFALAKAYADIDAIDLCMERLDEGNRLRKDQLGYDINRDKELFRRIQERCLLSPARLEPPVAPSSPRIIFILGLPRSGTTLVEQIIASHSKVFGAGELSTLDRVARPMIMGKTGQMTTMELAELRNHYQIAIDRLESQQPVITDKMPLNFLWVGLIQAFLPEAKIVHVKRDPIATCWSIYKHYFPARDLSFSCNLQDLATYWHLYNDLMRCWHQTFPGKIYDLDYERLTKHQEAESRKLLAFCELDWEPSCLDFHRSERVVRTASSTQVRQKIYQGSSQAWRKFEKHLGPLLAGLSDNG
ncbi:MAG: tetratricopeptide repeat protein [Desulfuromonadales bacterium]|nr:tetratricopeptide repeat protein [Desulfuromonadales bacterium]